MQTMWLAYANGLHSVWQISSGLRPVWDPGLVFRSMGEAENEEIAELLGY